MLRLPEASLFQTLQEIRRRAIVPDSQFPPGQLRRMAIVEQTLASFIPRTVRHAVSEGRGLFDGFPWTHDAVVVCIDISGFTRLAEACAALGDEGPERLEILTNKVLGPVVDSIEEAGGDIICFPGDAALALFPVVSTRFEEVIEHAAHSALAIATRKIDTDGIGDGMLSVRGGLSTGPVTLDLVGGAGGRLLPCLSGAAVIEAALLSNRVGPCQVGLSSGAVMGLGKIAVTGDVRDGLAMLHAMHTVPRQAETPRAPEPGRDVIENLVPDHVAELARNGQIHALAEFREVSILFANVPVAAIGEIDAGAVRRLTALFEQEVLALEGEVAQVAVDDKGLTLIAGWGVSGSLHEDDPRRAAEAALRTHAVLEPETGQVGTGVSTGTVFVGIRGNAARREIALIGARVVFAARLAGLGHVLVDDATRLASRRWFDFEPYGPVAVKGIDTPVLLHRPRRRTATRIEAARRMIGRETLLERIRNRIQRLRSGHGGGMVVVEAAPGMGKSLFLNHIVQALAELDVPALFGAGDALEVRTPYFAFREPATRALKGATTLAELEAVAAILGLDSAQRARLPLLAPLLARPVADNVHTRSLVGSGRIEATAALLVELFSAHMKRSPFALVIEDGHWLDSSSWTTALTLLRTIPGVLLIVAMRVGTAVPRVAERLLTSADTEIIRLEPLADASVAMLAAQVLGVESIPDQVRELVIDGASGHPYLVRQIAAMMSELGWIRILGSQCRVDRWPHDDSEFPRSTGLAGILGRRLDALPGSEQLVLKAASVIGGIVQPWLLSAVHPSAPTIDEIVVSTRALVDAGLLEQAGDGWRFDHALTRRTIYERLVFRQRRAMHERAARALVATWPAPGSAPDTLVAYHYFRAGCYQQARDHGGRAADEAYRNGANLEAAALYHEVLEADRRAEVVPAGPDLDKIAARWQARQGISLYRLGELDRARDCLEGALHRLDIPAPSADLRGAWLLLRETSSQIRLRYGLGPRALARVSADTGEAVAGAAERLAELWLWRRQSVPMLAATLASVNLAERVGRVDHASRSYAMLGFSLGVSKLGGLAERYFERARQAAEAGNDLHGATFCAYSYGVYLAGRARWPEARSQGGKAYQLATQLGDPQEIDMAEATLGNIEYFTGELDASCRRFENMVKNSRRRANLQHEAWGLYAASRCETMWAELDLAQEHAETALELFAHMPEATSELICWGILAEISRRRGDLDTAVQHADRASALIRAAPPTVLTLIDGYASVVAVHLSCWEQAGDIQDRRVARAATRRALRDMSVFAMFFPIGVPRLALLRGCAAYLAGKDKLALRRWRRALQQARDLGLPWEIRLAVRQLQFAGVHPAPVAGPHGGSWESRAWDLARVPLMVGGQGIPGAHSS